MKEEEVCRDGGRIQRILKGKKKNSRGVWSKHGNLDICVKIEVREFAAIPLNFI